DHGAEPGRPEAGHSARLGARRALAVDRGSARRAWNVHQGRRRDGGRESECGLWEWHRQAGGIDPVGLGEVEHRPSEGRCRRGGHPQGGAGAARQGAPAEPGLRAAESEHRLFQDAVLCEHRAAPLGDRGGWNPARRSERVRFRGAEFHAVLEEYVPGRIEGGGRKKTLGADRAVRAATVPRTPVRGALLLGGASDADLVARLRLVHEEAKVGRAPAPVPPRTADLTAPVRLAIDYGDAAELAAKVAKALAAFESQGGGMWRALRSQGIFRGKGPAPKTAFLYTGQGSQYLGMLAALRGAEPIVAATFAEADRVMTPILGRSLSSYLEMPT